MTKILRGNILDRMEKRITRTAPHPILKTLPLTLLFLFASCANKTELKFSSATSHSLSIDGVNESFLAEKSDNTSSTIIPEETQILLYKRLITEVIKKTLQSNEKSVSNDKIDITISSTKVTDPVDGHRMADREDYLSSTKAVDIAFNLKIEQKEYTGTIVIEREIRDYYRKTPPSDENFTFNNKVFESTDLRLTFDPSLFDEFKTVFKINSIDSLDSLILRGTGHTSQYHYSNLD